MLPETPLAITGLLGFASALEGCSSLADPSDFSWLFGDVNTLQTGDPDVFWGQIMS